MTWRMAHLGLLIGGLVAGLLTATWLVNASGLLYGRGSIAYVSSPEGNADIFLLDIDRGMERQVMNNPAQDLRPAWSPDGRYLIFYSNRDGFWNLYLMRANGLDVRPLTADQDSFGNPAWSPDGKRVAYDSTMAGNLEIYIMDCGDLIRETDCQTQQLTQQSGPDEFPAWSPDGKRIAFQALRTERREIYVMNLCDNETCDRNLTKPQLLYTGYFSHAGPAWSPDGQKLAFSAASVSQWSIYVLDADCYSLPSGCQGTAKQLTEATMNSFQPAWSPDGRSIVFQGWVDGNMELFVMDASGDSLRRLTHNNVDDRLPAWWP